MNEMKYIRSAGYSPIFASWSHVSEDMRLRNGFSVVSNVTISSFVILTILFC